MENQDHASSQINQRTVGVGDWFVSLLLLSIPFVNLIMLLVWAFGSGYPPSKTNFAKAALIWMVIGIVLCAMFFSTIVGLATALSNYA